MRSKVASALFATALLGASGTAAAQEKVIAIAMFIEHPVALQLLEGLRSGLTAAGITPEKGYRVDFQSAQGSTVTAAQIARKFVGDRPAVIVTLGTPVTQPVVQATKDIPVVFSGLADPIGAKVVSNLDRPGGNVTGLTDRAPFKTLLDAMTAALPAGKRIGIVYNSGEANARALVERFKTEAGPRGFTFAEATIAKASDVLSAAQSLVGKADIFYIPNDSTLSSNLEALHRVSVQAKIPTFASAIDQARRGATVATGVDYRTMGTRTAAIVVRVLKGESPGTIPVDVPESLDIAVNKKVAAEIGLALPPELVKGAKIVIE